MACDHQRYGEIDFTPGDPLEDPARGLIDAMVAEMKERYTITGDRIGVVFHPSDLAPPGGVYLVGRAGGQAVAGGGLRTIGPALGEIKRMYVVPAWRGRGAARGLLTALEDHARGLGMTRVRLDTGSRQPDARHLYESAGYAPIENYNGNDHAAFWGEKRL